MHTTLITGGTGSFGRAFIRQFLATTEDARIISVSRNAALRYELEQAHHGDTRLIVLPGDVRQVADLEPAFAMGVDDVIHAAAEKHIGTGQRHAQYTSSTNYLGALNVILLARRFGVARCVALSTDKACEPANFYGETKWLAEQAFVSANQLSGTRFSVVRYGNVVASSGSVIPLFLSQRESGRLTVTDRRMTRYFMPLSDPEYCDFPVFVEGQPAMSAVRLVLTALHDMHGGEIFIPQIPSASIQQLAESVASECEIAEIGMRDGEKLHEMLVSADESARTWRRPDGLYVVLPRFGATLDPSWQPVPNGFTYTSERTQRIEVLTEVA